MSKIKHYKEFKYSIKSKEGKVLVESIVRFGSEEKPFPEDWKDCLHTQIALQRYKDELLEKHFDVDISEDLEFEIKPKEITYIPRYSRTDNPDNMGRWARIAKYKGVQIAWVSRAKTDLGSNFLVSCNFPTMDNDTAKEHKVFDSFDDAKLFVEERWDWFTKNIAN